MQQQDSHEISQNNSPSHKTQRVTIHFYSNNTY